MSDDQTHSAPTHIEMVSADRDVPALFKHRLREKWGLGIVLRREDDRVIVQFQDGRARTFKRGFYHLFEAVDRRLDVALGIADALQSMTGDPTRAARSDRKRPVTLEEQVAFFLGEHAEGFASEAYIEAHRGDERARPLKRHRDALIAKAKEELAKKVIAKAIADGDGSSVHAAAGRVIASTDLIKVAERKKFLAIEEALHAEFAEVVQGLLYGKGNLTPRLDAFVALLERGLGDAPSWELATVLLGAVHADKHVVVRENVFTRQAVFMAPGLTIPKRPMGILYERLRAMAGTVREHLVDSKLEPRDMFDVHDFMWLTLKPAAQRAIREKRDDLGLGSGKPLSSEAA